MSACARRVAVRALSWHGSDLRHLSIGAGQPRVRVCVGAIRPVAYVAAGVSWTLLIASAPWAGRACHTTVIDAAGAIYVIGGASDSNHNITWYHDVWVSTDGGGHRTRAGVVGGVSPGGYYWGTRWYGTGVLQGYSRSTTKVLPGYYGVLEGYSRGA